MCVDLYTPFVLAYMRGFIYIYIICYTTYAWTPVDAQLLFFNLIMGHFWVTDSFVFHFDSSLLYNGNERPLIQKLYTVLFHLNSNWYSNKQQIYVILKSQ